MTTAINLTQKSKAVLKELIGVSSDAAVKIGNLLAGRIETISGPDDVAHLASELNEVEVGLAIRLLNFFASISITRLGKATGYKEIVEAMLASVEIPDGAVSFTKREKALLSKRLIEVFSNPELGLKSKAVRLRTNHCRVYDEAEVMSDMRPVYALDGTLKIQAAVVFHTIRIEYNENDEGKSFFCAMDSEDLIKLRDSVDRAIKKQKSLEDFLARSDLAIFQSR